VLTVSDDGRGIEPELLPHVFETFHQARDGGRTGGLGLGLAIVRHIVELHGGTVHVASEGLGKGSCFTVVLPIRAALRASEPDADQGAGHAPSRLLEGLHVLVVDDEEDAVELLGEVLRDAGAIVDVAYTGLQALARLDVRRPDAVVSDLEMPELDGYGLIRELRSHGTTENLPVIALTANALPRDRARALTAGFTAHVAKPVEPAELVLLLASSLGRTLP
jgi:CheY-like chemotaxis protein